MLYFIYGNPDKTFQKSQAMTEALLSKKPNASLFKINEDNFSQDLMIELLGGMGLFENKYIVTISRLLENPEANEYLLKNLKKLAESENIFFWVEEKVEKKNVEKIKKAASKIMFFDEIKRKAESTKMNIFDLAAAFGEKDKKRVWVLYQKAIKEFAPEEIFGTLWWQIKTILLAQKTKTPQEAGMKSFPYQKAKKYANNFKGNELQQAAKNIIKTYHQSRLDGESLGLNLEKFLLEY